MELLVGGLFLLLITVLIWYFLSKISQPSRNLPPKPWGFPLLGYLPFMVKNPHDRLFKLRRKLGDIFRIQIGSKEVIVLASIEAIKEAVHKQGENFGNRPEFYFFPQELGKGIIFSDFNKEWTKVHHSTLTILRELGVGKPILESHIQELVQHLLTRIKGLEGQPTEISFLLETSVASNMFDLIFGTCDETEVRAITKLNVDLSTYTDLAALEFIFPWIRKFVVAAEFFRLYSKEYKYKNNPFTKITEFVKQKLNKFELDDDGHAYDCFVNKWLLKSSDDAKSFPRNHLPYVLRDMILGGTETTATTLRWFLYYMMAYPEIQKRIQNEIDDIVGNERPPSLLDQTQMPFTEATLLEVQRMASVLPFGLLHENQSEAILNGYLIPAKSTVMTYIRYVHNDPEVFPEPEVFRPERFLSNGKVKKLQELIPFSIGRRQCMGEPLAKMQLFIYSTSILQKFSITKPEGMMHVDLSHCFATLVNKPKPQKMCTILRT